MKITVLTIAALLLLGGTAGANLLTNADFSAWTGNVPDGWTVEDTSYALVERSSNPVRSAPAAAKMTRLVAGTGSNKGLKQVAPVTAGQPYTLTAWCLDDDVNVGGGITMTWRDAGGTYISSSSTWYTDSSIHTWQRLVKTDTAPAGAATADCLLRCYGFSGSPSGGVIYYDDAEFVLGMGGVEEERPAPLRTLVTVRPNPTTGPARVRFELARSGPVSVAVYDRTGSRVALLAGGQMDAGSHEFVLDRRLSPGSYFVRVTGAANGLAKLVVR